MLIRCKYEKWLLFKSQQIMKCIQLYDFITKEILSRNRQRQRRHIPYDEALPYKSIFRLLQLIKKWFFFFSLRCFLLLSSVKVKNLIIATVKKSKEKHFGGRPLFKEVVDEMKMKQNSEKVPFALNLYLSNLTTKKYAKQKQDYSVNKISYIKSEILLSNKRRKQIQSPLFTAIRDSLQFSFKNSRKRKNYTAPAVTRDPGCNVSHTKLIKEQNMEKKMKRNHRQLS